MLNQKKMFTKILSVFGVEDISSQITFGGAWTGLHKRAYKIGNIVVISLEASTSTIVAGSLYTIANIANGYRPRNAVLLSGHTTNGSYVPQAVVNSWAEADGKITVRASNANGTYFMISGVYII
jgi:hypothetical protein